MPHRSRHERFIPGRSRPAALRAILAAALAACGSSSGTGGGGGNDPAAAGYVQSLGPFPAPAPDTDHATGPATVQQSDTSVCTSTPYTLSSAPKDVVMFSSDPQIMWPGALIVGTSYQDGALQLLPISQRAPVTLSIQGLYADQTSATIDAPTGSAVTAAVNKLLAQAVKDQTVPTNSIDFTETSAYSLDQAALKLGLSAHYLGARAQASLSVSTSTSESTVVAYALVRMFTVAVDPPATPADFFAGLTADTLQQQEMLGRIGPSNVPVYVASVTYGQIMMFSATASASSTDIKAALAASFNGFAGGASGSLSDEQKKLLESATINVVTLGGNGNAVRTMILDGTPADFFIGTDLITNAVPIAYTLKDLDGNVAKVGETSDYTLTTCTQNGFANFYVANEGSGGAGSVTGYYGNGSEAMLGKPITGLEAPWGLAYDTLDDALFVGDFGGSPVHARLRAFAADGSASSVVTAKSPFAGLANPSGLAYDPTRARLYVVDTPDVTGFGIVRAYSPHGDMLNLFFHAATDAFASYDAAYDPTNDRIYVGRSLTSESGGFVTVFKPDGSDVTPASSFPGLVLPEGIAYDPGDDRIYVSDYFQGKVLAFTPEGAPVALAHPITGLLLPKGLFFDASSNQLFVAVEGASSVLAYQPDGTPATGLTTPAFPDVNGPARIVHRP